MSYDPAPDLKKITCPVLALYAEKDFAVPAKLNVPAMRAALAGNKAGEVEELPDLNLLFQTSDVGIGREANWQTESDLKSRQEPGAQYCLGKSMLQVVSLPSYRMARYCAWHALA